MSEDRNIVVENELLRKGFTSVPNYIFGLPISSNAKLIYMALLSYAWTNNSCYPGLAKLCKDVSLSDKPVTKGIEELCRASLLEVKRRGLGKTNLYVIKEFTPSLSGQNGSETRIGESPKPESENLRIRTRQTSDSGNGHFPKAKTEKRRIPKKRIEKDEAEETTTEDTPTQNGRATRGVGVGSKFSLEECLRYAEHLHRTGQGITNPGGFAMSIYRSGAADLLIDEFLRPAEKKKPVDISLCPDCKGSGVYYPDGFENGVAKCRHARLGEGGEEPSEVRRLSASDIEEHSKLISELLGSGYTVEQAEKQFGSRMHPADWRIIEGVIRDGLREGGIRVTGVGNEPQMPLAG
ncbi:MAG: helix-turn-helix domain-containing protein [Acidobacteriota bacterium]|nr:helix-turn-helix domain-containing protein [Acidobacteriota bacterium]